MSPLQPKLLCWRVTETHKPFFRLFILFPNSKRFPPWRSKKHAVPVWTRGGAHHAAEVQTFVFGCKSEKLHPAPSERRWYKDLLQKSWVNQRVTQTLFFSSQPWLRSQAEVCTFSRTLRSHIQLPWGGIGRSFKIRCHRPVFLEMVGVFMNADGGSQSAGMTSFHGATAGGMSCHSSSDWVNVHTWRPYRGPPVALGNVTCTLAQSHTVRTLSTQENMCR